MMVITRLALRGEGRKSGPNYAVIINEKSLKVNLYEL
jgi:hypothetical protein